MANVTRRVTRRLFFGLLAAAAGVQRAVGDIIDRRGDHAPRELADPGPGPDVAPADFAAVVQLERADGRRMEVLAALPEYEVPLFIADGPMKIMGWSITPLSKGARMGDLAINHTPIMRGNLNGEILAGDVLSIRFF